MRTELYKARSTVAHEAFGWDIYRIFYQYVTKTSDSYSNCMSYGQLSLVSMRDLKRARRQSNHSPKACRSLTSDALRQLRYETHKLRKLKPRPSLPRIRFQYAPSYLRKCSSVQLREIKRFSRNGGPDLSDIFGVCSDSSLTTMSTTQY
ncbi:hypothetical protein BDV18DRAFT_100420 [Aspergillus unguis]